MDKLPAKSSVSLVVNHDVSANGIYQSVKEEKVGETDPSQIIFGKEEEYSCQGDIDFENWTNQSDDYSCQSLPYKLIKKKPGEKHNGPRKVIPGSNSVMYVSGIGQQLGSLCGAFLKKHGVTYQMAI